MIIKILTAVHDFVAVVAAIRTNITHSSPRDALYLVGTGKLVLLTLRISNCNHIISKINK